MQFEIRHKGVPVCYGSPSAGPRMLIKAGETERIRDQRGAGYVRAGHHSVGDLLRIEGLTVEKQLRVKFPRPPSVKYRSDVCLRGSQQRRNRTEIRRSGDDLPRIKIAIGPTVK